jgi:hypothetical protein
MNSARKNRLRNFLRILARFQIKAPSLAATTILFVLGYGGLVPTAKSQSGGIKVFESNIQIPSGVSSLTVYFTQPRQLYDLLVTYQPSAQCSSFTIQLETSAPGRPWSVARNINGYFRVDPFPMTAMKMNFTSQYQKQICFVSVQNFASPQNDSGPLKRILLGNISFRGGFVADQKLDFPEVTSLAKIQVFLPRYCNNLEILDAALDGTPSEFGEIRGEDSYELLEDTLKWYEISSPPSRRAKSLRLSLSGPVGQVCELPVYAFVFNGP